MGIDMDDDYLIIRFVDEYLLRDIEAVDVAEFLDEELGEYSDTRFKAVYFGIRAELDMILQRWNND